MNKTFRILEIVWLIMTFVGLFMFIYSMVVSDRTGAIYFLVFFIVCGIMFSARRRQRKKFDQKMEEQRNKVKQ